eukprot:TRINITY_DN8966_c0_g1_i2.p1 TRINITY_DN8966_c0_g1~~TRINITY_DN8966_c0_g1_i2.p1  ORF type:complete len:624 (+),score=144.40 TRINITY_DN8966_c0_g1_i2:106-1977(+)
MSSSTIVVDVDAATSSKPELQTTSSTKLPIVHKQNASYELAFENLNVFVATKRSFGGCGAVQERKQILKNVSGRVHSGQMLAIIGPSGSGKTTTLDVLAGLRETEPDSRVTINGEPLNSKLFSKLCSYMPQEDRLNAALTVHENLDFALRLIDGSLTKAQRNDRIQDVLKQLGLTSVADSRVGDILLKGISGGQKRRLSIGVELISNPAVLFLDEPTSGLDAASAASIMQLLARLAQDMGLLVVASVHQPATDIFLSFDQLLLLSSGRTAFFGSARASLDYFEKLGYPSPTHANPADHLLKLVNSDFEESKDRVNVILDAWQPAMLAADNRAITMPEDRSPGFLGKTAILMKRSALDYLKNPLAFGARLANYVIMAIVLGTMYVSINNDQEGILQRAYLIQWMLGFNGFLVVSSLGLFSLARDVVSKEVLNGQYKPSHYVLATSIVQIPACFLIALGAATPVFWIAGPLRDDAGVYIIVTLIVFMLVYTMEGIAILIGTLVHDWITGYVIGDSVVSIFFVFDGFFIRVGKIPWVWRWISYISPFRYASDAIIHVVFDGAKFSGYQDCLSDQTQACFGDRGEDFLGSIVDNGDDVNVGVWMLIMLIMAIVARTLVWLALKHVAV